MYANTDKFLKSFISRVNSGQPVQGPKGHSLRPKGGRRSRQKAEVGVGFLRGHNEPALQQLQD